MRGQGNSEFAADLEQVVVVIALASVISVGYRLAGRVRVAELGRCPRVLKRVKVGTRGSLGQVLKAAGRQVGLSTILPRQNTT